jgi:DNA-binding CsgD family transcriptional regulator
MPEPEWDVFISHAWEDKEAIARPLAEALTARGLRVWFDEFTLAVGDRLRRSIDKGLAHSQYGIVILSPHFFAKEWPQKELDGLTQRENRGEKVILPVWHNIEAEQIRACSPALADRIGVRSNVGLERVVAELLRGMGLSFPTASSPAVGPASAGSTGPVEPLTRRELEVLTWIAQQLTNKEIADRMGVQPKTVQTHVIRILVKLRADNRHHAVALARTLGILPQ